jgi:arginase
MDAVKDSATASASRRRTIAVVAVHMDLGAGRRGVDMGPSAIRVANLATRLTRLGHDVKELGSVFVPEPEACPIGEEKTKYLREIRDCCLTLREKVARVLDEGAIPLVLGGDHSIAIGSVSAQAIHHRKQGQPVGLVWMDAHADMNLPETTPSGNVHGMPLSVLLGRGARSLVEISGEAPAVRAEHVAIVGARDLDKEERRIVKESGVRVFTMAEIDERGMGTCMDEALGRAMSGTAGFHLSFDLDGVDPQHAPGVGTPVPGGLTYREAHLACEKAAQTGRLLGMDMVELNPIHDEANRTAKLAVELILSAFGKTIL